MKRTLRWLGGCMLLLSAGCAPSGPDLVGEQLSGGEVQDLGGQLERALVQTAHAGQRRVESTYVIGEERVHLVYVEDVFTDGRGNFAVEPVRVIEGAETDFLLRQKQRVGYAFKYRDFAIRDTRLFQQNYIVSSEGEEVVIAGRLCSRFETIKRGGDRIHTVSMDNATGLVLMHEERTLDGQLVSSMQYLSFQLNPDLSRVDFHEPIIEASSMDYEALLNSAQTFLGFEPLVPTWLPFGYALSDVSIAEDVDPSGRDWLRLVYTDGVDTMFFLHGGDDPDYAPPSTLFTAKGEKGVMGSGRLQYFEIAPLFIMEGSVKFQKVMMVGKVSLDDMRRTLTSAL